MMSKKKILLLGGSYQQIIAIETAKKLGYTTLLCDYLPDNPGQYVADKFYLVSTTEKESVLDIAQKENIDGILAYASDPAAPTAAYVAEKLNLPGNPYKYVDILCNKDKFRMFLSENNFNVAKMVSYSDYQTAVQNIACLDFSFPIIVKPVDSSGSKGTTVLYSLDHIEHALEFAFSFSRSKRIIVEEFIEKKHKYLIGGDIFVLNGKIVQWGLMNCHRDAEVNPLVPVGKSFPLLISNDDFNNVKFVLQRLVDLTNFKNGAINVELVIDKNDDVYLIDVGPRNGGNMIPDLLGYIFDCDIVKMTVESAIGNEINYIEHDGIPFFATYNLHSRYNGTLKNIIFSSEINKFIVKKCIYKKTGDLIDRFSNASNALGIVFFKFSNMDEMLDIIERVDELIKVLVEEV